MWSNFLFLFISKICNFESIMKVVLSISLSVLLLAQTFNFGAKDVLHLKDLVEHAQLHSEKYGDSFFDFLTKHYGSSKYDHYASHEGHENLPFKPDNAKATVNIYVVDDPQSFELKLPPLQHPRVMVFYKNSYSSQSNQKIFQPPKQA